MANPNVEHYRALIEAFNAGGVEGVLARFDPAVEIFDPDRPDGGRFVGHDGVIRFFADLLEGLEEVHIRIESMVPAGDRVLGLVHSYGRGDGGVEIEIRDAHAFTFRDGLIIYWRAYTDRDEALADAGIDDDAAALTS